MRDKLILAGVFAVGLTAMVVSRCSHAELRLLDTQEANNDNTLSYFEGSGKANKDLSQGIFSVSVDKAVQNMQIAIQRSSCDAGVGTIYFFDLHVDKIVGTYDWVSGDGSMAAVAADLLCKLFVPSVLPKLPDAKAAPKKSSYKQAAYSF